MAFAPVDYGPQIAPDTQGLRELEQQQAAVFRDVHEIGSAIEGGAQAITQGILHTQALKATAAVKEKQAKTLQTIDSNPYIQKSALQQMMKPEDYEAWHAGLAAEYKDADAVPMFTVSGALFDSQAKQAREEAGKTIGLPGWRERWNATEQTESETIRERYVNRMAADQMIADQRAQTLTAIDKMVDSAVKPEDLQAAAKMAETSPWLKPAERRFAMEKALVAKDSFIARHAMLGEDAAVMADQLDKLRSNKAAELYPNMNEKQRLDLANQLTREYGVKMVKHVADSIVGPNVDEHGKVNSTGIAEALAAYKGPNKEDVTKQVKAEESAKQDIFDKRNAEIQRSIFTAGQDPMTGRFDYARAMKNPEMRKAAVQLNADAPGLISALNKENQRIENIDSKADALERRLANAAHVKVSGENLAAEHKRLDDPANYEDFKKMTPAQYDSRLYNMEMTEPDRAKARAAFAQLTKTGGPDERAKTSVDAEIFAAAKGDTIKTKQLKAKYEDVLLQSAHQFIRQHPELTKDAMTDALREYIKGEMLSGKVVGSSNALWPDDTKRRIEWETNPDYSGKSFKLPDGTVIAPAAQRVRLTKDGKTGTFNAADAVAARADGWK